MQYLEVNKQLTHLRNLETVKNDSRITLNHGFVEGKHPNTTVHAFNKANRCKTN
jgi:hypothetical protein